MSSQTMLQNVVTRFRETSLDLLEYAKIKRNEGIFNDVTLQVDNLSIGANRMVLSCCSAYFETMFKTKLRERYESNIQVTGVGGKTAKILIDYMYNGQITIDDKSVMDILAGADYFQLDEVKRFCFEYLSNRLTCENWCAVQTAAALYRSDQLQTQINDFINDYFDEIVQNIDFKTFVKHDLTLFVSNLNRNQVNESAIYQAIMNWIKQNEDERKKDFPDLFQLVDLNKLSSDALQDILSESIVQENVTCAKSVLSLLSKLMKKTKAKESESKILMIGGIKNSKKVTEIFNCNCVEPNSYPDLLYDVYGHCLLKLNDVVFCIGGGSTNTNEVYNKISQMKLNETNLKWSDVAPMNEKRWLHSAAVLRGHLVVAGGRRDEIRWASTEYFDSSSGKWQTGPALQRKRSEFSLVECQNNLFAFGGYDGEERLSSVERLRSFKRQWEYVAPMLRRRAGVAGVSLNGCIYAIGGRSGEDVNSRQKTVERYDPKLNKWSYVCEMNYVRSGGCACVLNERIFVAGGLDVDGELVKEIECYDPYQDKWKIVQFFWKNKLTGDFAIIVI